MARREDKDAKSFHTSSRFKERTGKDWVGDVVDYKEVELLRKLMRNSMSDCARWAISATRVWVRTADHRSPPIQTAHNSRSVPLGLHRLWL